MVLWDRLNSLFHAFKVCDLGLILLKGVGTFTNVKKMNQFPNNDGI
jgi:hypothetical protein